MRLAPYCFLISVRACVCVRVCGDVSLVGSLTDCKFAHLARWWRWIGCGAPCLNRGGVVNLDKASERWFPNSVDVHQLQKTPLISF